MGDKRKPKEEDQLLNSNYDGIQEYDNDLPRWWVQLFLLTIVFGLVYATFVHLTGAPSDLETLRAEMQDIRKLQAQVSQQNAQSQTTSLETKINDQTVIAKGQEVYTAKCAACHGDKGQGLVGPNLTDNYWIHGGAVASIHKTIVEGVMSKGMLAWKGVIPDEDIDAVTVYIYSIKGTNVAGKGPEGEQG